MSEVIPAGLKYYDMGTCRGLNIQTLPQACNTRAIIGDFVGCAKPKVAGGS